MAEDTGDPCYICKGISGDTNKWIGCILCPNWSHLKCAFLSGVKSENIRHINWMCSQCVQKAKLTIEWAKKIDSIKEKFSEELLLMKKEVELKLDIMQGKICEVAEVIPESAPPVGFHSQVHSGLLTLLFVRIQPDFMTMGLFKRKYCVI